MPSYSASYSDPSRLTLELELAKQLGQCVEHYDEVEKTITHGQISPEFESFKLNLFAFPNCASSL